MDAAKRPCLQINTLNRFAEGEDCMPKMNYCPQCGKNLIEKEINDKIYLACSLDACNYVFWDNPIPVVSAIAEYKDDVILLRNKGWPEKVFGLVTGFLEKGESPENAVVREIQEEIGLRGKIEKFIGLYSFIQMNQLLIVYHVKCTGEITLGEEIQEIRHIAPDKLRTWDFGTGPALKDWLEMRKQKNS